MLALVVCALALSLAYPLKQYLVQRGEIRQLHQQQAAVQDRVAALEERKRQLSDPAYLRAQARKRQHYVLPGERVYVVVTPSAPGQAGPAGTPLPAVRPDGSWYGRLWRTVRVADGLPAP